MIFIYLIFLWNGLAPILYIEVIGQGKLKQVRVRTGVAQHF